MLEKIIINNFKTFKNETVIDLSKTNYSILPQNVSEDGILKGAIIIGPNASGKSTVIEAIKLLLDGLFGEKLLKLFFYKCLFSKETSFSLKYYFHINGEKVIYEMSINPLTGKIKEELAIGSEENIVLERDGDKACSRIADKNGISYDEKSVAKDTLFLRTLYFNTKFSGNEILTEWMDFLQSSVYIDAVTNTISSYENNDFQLSAYLKKNGTEQLNQFLNSYNFKYEIEYSNKSVGNLNAFEISDDANEKTVFFKRKDIEEPIPFRFESMGNKNLLKLLPSYLHIINGKGMLLIDEFSSGFHPVLEKLLIKFFMKNSTKSQFIFVSHSVSLVSNTVMRPDQVYAIEFEGMEGSKVIRFSDFQPRTAQNVEKMYLAGIFGALPNYEEVVDESEQE